MKLGYLLLYVEDVETSVTFYEEAFGLKRKFLAPTEDGSPTDYAEMATAEGDGGTTLGFVSHKLAGSHGFSYRRPSDGDAASPMEVGLVTGDVPSAFAKAVAAGCESVLEPVDKPWGQTVSYVRDRDGFLVEICSPVTPPSEQA